MNDIHPVSDTVRQRMEQMRENMSNFDASKLAELAKQLADAPPPRENQSGDQASISPEALALQNQSLQPTIDAGQAVQSTDPTEALGEMENRPSTLTESPSAAAKRVEAAADPIRDAEMAAAVVNVTALQIMQQNSAAVPAQANLSSQQVLGLLD